MEVLRPQTLQQALQMRAEHAGALPIAGGTDVMVDLNFDRARPETILDLGRVEELRRWHAEDGHVFLGSGLTFARIMRELPQLVPLVQASRTVGSPQIRNRGTIGGNLGTASPAGDALPVLAAYEADVVLGRAGGATRSLPWHSFLTGVKRTALEPDELILGVRWRIVRGTGSFSKVGVRNAMVISIASLCLQADEDGRAVRIALGSVAPGIARAGKAESLLAEVLEESGAWDDPTIRVPETALAGFGEAVAEAASPIDDVRGTATYRRHAVAVIARRALAWALTERAAAEGL